MAEETATFFGPMVMRAPSRMVASGMEEGFAGDSSVAIWTPAQLFGSGEAGGWYDPSDLSTMYIDDGVTNVTSDGDAVYRIDDKSGNGNHAKQATAAARPVYKTDGTYHWLQFDGIDDTIGVNFSISQPFTRVSAASQNSYILNDQILGGRTANAGALYNSDTLNRQISIYSGTILGAVQTTQNVANVFTERHSGASSRVAKNNDSYITGNAGTTLPGGIMIGGANTGATTVDAKIYGVCMCGADLSDADIALLRTYIGAQAGVTL